MYPTLNSSKAPRQTIDTIDTFAGYNHNLKIGDNEFYDVMNLSSDEAPVLAPRRARGLYVASSNVQGMIEKDSLCYVDGSYFVMNQYRVDMGLSVREEDCPKQLVSMGAYVVIFPDKMYINTLDLTDFGSLDAEFTSVSDVTFSLCKQDGTVYQPDYIQPEEPAGAENMAIWMDTSDTPHSLKQWSASAGIWSGIATTYIKIQCVGIGKAFSQYDGVKISIQEGITASTADQINALNGSHVIYAADDDSITVTGILDEQTTVAQQITVSRKMPLVDFVIENDNRLWGCRYGMNRDGEVVNELYACKLGDFKNWECYMGISTDSYAVSLGSDGQFTGAITHAGYPIFFKENCMHKVYGYVPSNFQVQTTPCRGVQKGCSRSLAIVNEILFYKSRNAICAYDGSLPTEISSAFGNVQYQNAVAGSHGNKYYVSMQEVDSGNPIMMVYDTSNGLWHKEDGVNAVQFCSCRGELYCATEDGKIITMLGSGDSFECIVAWMAETGIINASYPERKYLKRINIRLALDPGSTLSVSAEYNSCGTFKPIGTMTGDNIQSFTFPVRPKRCDHLRLRFDGYGKAIVFSITKTISGGSDSP